jgi:uncharacterized protein YjiK
VFHPGRKTLFCVTDKGYVVEMGTDGTLIRKVRVREKADFEGITCDPATGMLYIAIEKKDTILKVDPQQLAVVQEIPIERGFRGRVLLDAKGKGVEGITFDPGRGTLFLVNQSDDLAGKDPSIVFQVAIDSSATSARIITYFGVGVTDLSGIHYDAAKGQLLIISDSNDVLITASPTGKIVAIHTLPGVHQEGITLDAAGFLYIVQDVKEERGGLLKFKPAMSR